MEQAKRVVKNTGILYVQMGITVLLSLYTTRLVLKALGASDFGVFNLIGGIITMLLFLNSSMTAASQRFMSYAEGEGRLDKQKSIFNISVALHLIIGIFLFLLLEMAGLFLFDGFLQIDATRMATAEMIFHFMVLSTFFTIVAVPYDAVINAHENMLLVAIVRIVEVILKFCIALYLTKIAGDKLLWYGALMSSITFVLLVIKGLYCHLNYREVQLNIKKYYNKTLFKEMTSFAGWSFLGSSASILSNYGQGMVLNVFFGTLVNAAQGISLQINGQLSSLANTMMKALNPVLAKNVGSGNIKNMVSATISGSKFSFYLLMLLFIPVLIELKFLLKLWLVDVPDYAIVFTILLLVRTLIEQLFIPLGASINAIGKIKLFQICESVVHAMPLIASFLFFKFSKGPEYLYFSFLCYALIKGGVRLYFANKFFSFEVLFFLKEVIFKVSIIFLLTYCLSSLPMYFLEIGFLRFCLIAFISTVLSIFLIFKFGLADVEKNVVYSFLTIIKSKLQ